MPYIPAEELFKLLEEKDLVPPEVLAQLRAQVAQSLRTVKPINAAMAAKILVDRGYLSRLLAQRLMSQLEAEFAQKTHRQKPAPVNLKPFKTPPKKDVNEEISLADEEPIELFPLGGENQSKVPVTELPGKRKAGPSGKGKEKEVVIPPPSEMPSAGPLSRFAPHTVSPAPSSPSADVLSDLELPPPAVGPTALGSEAWTVRRRSPWESPLFLLGAGTLLILLFVGVILLWSLNRRTGDEILADADADFQSGSYTQAIHKYEKFLEDFPRHPAAGAVKVRRGLAQIRQALQTTDPATAFQSFKKVLAEISPLPDFHAEADAEMTAVLPKLAKQLAQAALEKRAPDLVQAAEEALSYCQRYIPREQRPGGTLAEIQATVELAKRQISLKDELTSTLTQIRQAVEGQHLDEAYAAFDRFTSRYPQAGNDAQLKEAMRQVAAAETARVRWEASSQQKPAASPRPQERLVVGYIPWVGGSAPLADLSVAVLTDQEHVFGIQGSGGKLLWQRPLGQTTVLASGGPPPVLALEGRETVVLPDGSRPGLIAVDTQTGEIKRTIPLEEPVCFPLVADRNGLLALGVSGAIYAVNVSTSQIMGKWVFPLRPAFPPIIDSVADRYYVLAEHSQLFIIDAKSHACQIVHYLGHQAGQLSAWPVLFGGYLLIPQYQGSQRGRLVVVDTRDKSESSLKEVQNIDLPEPVTTPPQALNTRFAVITTGGQVHVFQLRLGKAEEPCGPLASGKTPDPAPGQKDQVVPRYIVFRQDQVITADRSLTLFELQASSGKLVPRWVACEESQALTAPQIRDSVIFYVHRSNNRTGLFVTAVDAESGRIYWETHLGDWPAGEPQATADGKAFIAATQGGALYQVDPTSGAPTVAGFRPSQPVKRRIEELTTTPQGWALSPDYWALVVPGSTQLTMLRLAKDQTEVSSRDVPWPISGISFPFNNGLLLTFENGAVGLFDRTAQVIGQPYQAPIAAGKRITWTGGTALDQSTLVLSHAEGDLIKLRWEDVAGGRLVEVARQVLKTPITGGLAHLQGMIAGVDVENRLAFFSASDLSPLKTKDLGAAVRWGPVAAGGVILFSTAGGDLVTLTPGGESTGQNSSRQAETPKPSPDGSVTDEGPFQVRRIAIQEATPVGRPAELGDTLAIATRQGAILLMNRGQSDKCKVKNYYVPFATGPVLVGEHVVVATRDGAWLIVSKNDLLDEHSSK